MTVEASTGTSRRKTGRENKEDLTVVEGIGPKIAELLNAADIWTFEDLAFTPVTRLREILDAGGSRFQIHNPETWPRQSALASVGNWEGLRAWQDVLNAGKTVSNGNGK